MKMWLLDFGFHHVEPPFNISHPTSPARDLLICQIAFFEKQEGTQKAQVFDILGSIQDRPALTKLQQFIQQLVSHCTQLAGAISDDDATGQLLSGHFVNLSLLESSDALSCFSSGSCSRPP